MKKGDLVTEFSKGYPPVFKLAEDPTGDRVMVTYVGDIIGGRLEINFHYPANVQSLRVTADLSPFTR